MLHKLRSQRIPSTQEKLKVHYSQAADLVVQVQTVDGAKAHRLRSQASNLNQMELANFQTDRNFPCPSKTKRLKTNVGGWIGSVNEFAKVLETLAVEQKQPFLESFTWRTPQAVNNELRQRTLNRPRNVQQMKLRLKEDFTLCIVLPSLGKNVHQSLVGANRKGDRIRCFVIEQKFKLLEDLTNNFNKLINQWYRKSVLKVLDETCLPTDCGRIITQFLVKE